MLDENRRRGGLSDGWYTNVCQKGQCLLSLIVMNLPLVTCSTSHMLVISETDPLRQLYVWPLWDTSGRLATSPSHSRLTTGQPVIAQILERQATGRAATGVPVFKSLA